jgi:hypothetical protein
MVWMNRYPRHGHLHCPGEAFHASDGFAGVVVANPIDSDEEATQLTSTFSLR